MNVIILGASGMVGQGVLRECVLDPEVKQILLIGRAPLADVDSPKVQQINHRDFSDFSSIEEQLKGYDACFYSLGVSVVGLSEEAYTRVTKVFAIALGKVLAKLNPEMTFTYVSGTGTDRHSKTMWARVKGETEYELQNLFKNAYMFRAGLIQPLHGIKSKTFVYRLPYIILAPIMPLLVKYLPKYVTTTEQVGRAMIAVAKRASPKHILENEDINQL